MKWRRGLLFALIHIGIAVPLIVWQEARDWPFLSSRGCGIPDPPPAPVVLKEGEVAFEPVNMWDGQPQKVRIVSNINLPAEVVAEWHWPYPSKHTLAGVVAAACGSKPRRESEVIVSLGFVLLIFLQWLVVGALPFRGLSRLWYEPSGLITLCAVVAVLGLALPHDWDVLGALAPLIALVVWLVWFLWLGVLLLRVAKAGWTRLAASR